MILDGTNAVLLDTTSSNIRHRILPISRNIFNNKGGFFLDFKTKKIICPFDDVKQEASRCCCATNGHDVNQLDSDRF